MSLCLQTCYEMEKWLKDEPKHHQVKKEKESAADSATWSILGIGAGPLNLDNLHLDAISTASSACSWESAVSCQVGDIARFFFRLFPRFHFHSPRPVFRLFAPRRCGW